MTHLAWQNCSECSPLTVPHAPLVPVQQLTGCGVRPAQAVAVQCHLHICVAAEVAAACFDPLWQAPIWRQDSHNSLQRRAAADAVHKKRRLLCLGLWREGCHLQFHCFVKL